MDITKERFHKAVRAGIGDNQPYFEALRGDPARARAALLELCLAGKCQSKDGDILKAYIAELADNAFVEFASEN